MIKYFLCGVLEEWLCSRLWISFFSKEWKTKQCVWSMQMFVKSSGFIRVIKQVSQYYDWNSPWSEIVIDGQKYLYGTRKGKTTSTMKKSICGFLIPWHRHGCIFSNGITKFCCISWMDCCSVYLENTVAEVSFQLLYML